MGFVIVAMAVLSIATAIFSQQTISLTPDNQTAPLDWYFSHDHAVIGGDNDGLSTDAVSASPNRSSITEYMTLKDRQLEKVESAGLHAKARPKDYAALKEAQLDEIDTRNVDTTGSMTFPGTARNDSPEELRRDRLSFRR